MEVGFLKSFSLNGPQGVEAFNGKRKVFERLGSNPNLSSQPMVGLSKPARKKKGSSGFHKKTNVGNQIRTCNEENERPMVLLKLGDQTPKGHYSTLV